MANQQYRASLNKGRSGWCVIFRHPIALASDGKQKLRVRRGLSTRDDAVAANLVAQLNEILSDSSLWAPSTRSLAESKYDHKIVAAFYDHITCEQRDQWLERDRILPLPSREDGYAKVQFVGTTGAGKTTIVRQFLGTDPSQERFPSTSAAKTTICDLEMILKEGPFQAAVSFIARDQARNCIAECVSAAVAAHLEDSHPSEIIRRFMEHSELKFRLSYVLGLPGVPKESRKTGLFEDDDDYEESKLPSETELSAEQRIKNANVLQGFLNRIESLADNSRKVMARVAADFGVDLNDSSTQERDTLQELVEGELEGNEEFHSLVDDILDEVESRFDFVSSGDLIRGRDGWPTLWKTDTDNRADFIRSVNRFSSNYAPNFGCLLTPLVEGIRVQGPFLPTWHKETIPKIVLMDGQGIGHTADSTSSISTNVTKRFQIADSIVLVDNAAQPLQAAPVSVLRTLVTSGHESKLIVAFTHFDEVNGDNLVGLKAKKDHVVGSYLNAVQSIGKQVGRESENALKRLHPERIVFLARIQTSLPENAGFVRSELAKMLKLIGSSIKPLAPVEFRPGYDVANLVFAIQKATQEFHEHWHAIFGQGSRSYVRPEHWTRVKALTRHIALLEKDEYQTLRPNADLIQRLQERIGTFLSDPLDWTPVLPRDATEEIRARAIAEIRREVNTRLHKLSRRRLIQDRIGAWIKAYQLKGNGSTRSRAKELVGLYEVAAPIPNEMPGPDANAFLFEVRELVAESIEAAGGELHGWKRSLNAAESQVVSQ